MKIEWIQEEEEKLKTALKKRDFSKRLISKIKYRGGKMEVNGKEVTVRKMLNKGDEVSITLPAEEGNDYLTPSDEPLHILYEDDHLLLIDKPSGVTSVPSPATDGDTMANRVKGYVERQRYRHQGVHVVTRLDRYTSGVMLFAKHSMAHSLLDKQLQQKQIEKMYQAILEGAWSGPHHGVLDGPISRTEESIILRKVAPGGKKALTEYWVNKRFPTATLMDVQLHTGRTHQIRVHFAHAGFPLVGDDLYGGTETKNLNRQGLHCAALSFKHPFTGEAMHFQSPLPRDMETFLTHPMHQQEAIN